MDGGRLLEGGVVEVEVVVVVAVGFALGRHFPYLHQIGFRFLAAGALTDVFDWEGEEGISGLVVVVVGSGGWGEGSSGAFLSLQLLLLLCHLAWFSQKGSAVVESGVGGEGASP